MGLVAEGSDAPDAGEFGGVVELGHVGWVSSEEGFFEEFDHGALESDYLALELVLGDHCTGDGDQYARGRLVDVKGNGPGMDRQSPSANFGPMAA